MDTFDLIARILLGASVLLSLTIAGRIIYEAVLYYFYRQILRNERFYVLPARQNVRTRRQAGHKVPVPAGELDDDGRNSHLHRVIVRVGSPSDGASPVKVDLYLN